MVAKDTGNTESGIKSHEIPFERYRTIAYEGADPFRPEHAIREMDPSFGKLLPTNLDARILDIGCGMGQFLQYLKLKGYRNLADVELSPEQVDYCRWHITQKVVLTSDVISFLAEQPGSWDSIVFKDVIEHLPRAQVIPTLSAIFEAVAPDGFVIIETANLATPAGMFVRYIDFTHESGFTENSIRQVLRAVGFQKIEVYESRPAVYSWRSYFRNTALWSWHRWLRLIYGLERGWAAAPKVLSQVLIVRAKRSK